MEVLCSVAHRCFSSLRLLLFRNQLKTSYPICLCSTYVGPFELCHPGILKAHLLSTEERLLSLKMSLTPIWYCIDS